jgi:photosystem II stability/assembly factor-like uncharacterized protein
MLTRCFSLVVLLFPLPVVAQWQPQEIDSDADFRGLCVVSEKVVWVSGTKGTFGRTADGGKSWSFATVPDAGKLDFRDVEAFNDKTAYLMSAGPGEASRIYRTDDGGKTWTLQFQCRDADSFLDGIAFWNEQNGMAFGDPVKGKFQLFSTSDGGKNWKPLPEKNLPEALPKEAAFAASGTSIMTRGENDLWFATGGGKVARLFHSPDRGQTWEVIETPIRANIESSGIFSLHFRDEKNGMLVGGDYRQPTEKQSTVAITTDGGKTWNRIENALPFRSGISGFKSRWIAVGITGSDQSEDHGKTWKRLDGENYNSVGFTVSGEGWAVGPKGRIARFSP